MLVLYRAVLSVGVLLVGRFCMEFLLLCLGEGDGEEKIKHEVQLYCVLRHIFIKAVAGGVYGTLLCFYSVW